MAQTDGKQVFGKYDATSESEKVVKDTKKLEKHLEAENLYVISADPRLRI